MSPRPFMSPMICCKLVFSGSDDSWIVDKFNNTGKFESSENYNLAQILHEETSSQLDFNYDGHRGNKVEERYGNETFNHQDKGLYKNEAGGFTISNSNIGEGSYLEQSDSLLLQHKIKGNSHYFNLNIILVQLTD